MPKSALELYQKYFQERNFERLDLFEIIADKFNIQRVLYPGSFIHITPSFIFPDVVYVDNDRQAHQFFGRPKRVSQKTSKRYWLQSTSLLIAVWRTKRNSANASP